MSQIDMFVLAVMAALALFFVGSAFLGAIQSRTIAIRGLSATIQHLGEKLMAAGADLAQAIKDSAAADQALATAVSNASVLLQGDSVPAADVETAVAALSQGSQSRVQLAQTLQALVDKINNPGA